MSGARRVLSGYGLVLLALVTSSAGAGPLEVRVRSETPGGKTQLTITVDGGAGRVIDRTPDARGAAAGRLSAGSTFADEITLELPDVPLGRSAVIDVSDDLVSEVRVSAVGGGSRVVVFVRQPVDYVVRALPEDAGIEVALAGVAPATRGAVTPGHLTPAGRGRPETDDDRVAVDAESVSYDQAKDTVTARGGVTIRRGDMTLRADEVQYDRTNEIARAAGRVTLLDPEMTIRGAAAEVDLGREIGWVDDAAADLPESRYRLQAARIEKCGPVSYTTRDATFTTCRCGGLEKPTWSVTSDEADVTLGGFGTARNARFRLQDVPVLRVPRLVFPAATERQSGFLLPRVGYSNRDGFQYQQPFYWAIDKSSDATVVADVETAARVGGAAEYRYVLSQQARGALTAAYFNEHIGGNLDDREARRIEGDPDVPENRFAFVGRHVQPFVGDSTWYVDLFAISDDLFLREIDFPAGVDAGSHPHSTRFTRSRTGVIKTWDGGLLKLETAYFQDLIDPQELALQPVPEISAEHAVPLLDGRLVARVAGDTTVFQREQGFDGWRTQLAPELSVPFQLGRFAYGSVRGVAREQLYYLIDTEQVGLAFPNDPEILPRFRQVPTALLPALDRTHAQASAEVSARLGTQVARVYEFPHWGLDRLRHTIEPEMRFVYVPELARRFETVVLPACTGAPNEREGIDCDGRLFTEPYLFDQADAINRRSFLAYGVTSRLFGRAATPAAPVTDDAPGSAAAAAVPVEPPGPPRELLRVSLLHGYDVTREVVNDSHASDVDVALRVTPVRFAGLGYSATVSFQDRKLIGQSVGLFLREPWTPPSGLEDLQQPSTLVASYRFVTENASRGIAPNSAEEALFRNVGVEELAAGVYLRLSDHLGFSYLSRYDFTTSVVPGREVIGPHFLEQTFLVRLLSRCNCWMLDIGVRDRFDTDETSVVAQFTLVGLGGAGGAPGLQSVGFRAIPGLATTPRFGAGGGNW